MRKFHCDGIHLLEGSLVMLGYPKTKPPSILTRSVCSLVIILALSVFVHADAPLHSDIEIMFYPSRLVRDVASVSLLGDEDLRT